ncbi:MAG: ATP-binding protein [Bacteroidota bacterium]
MIMTQRFRFLIFSALMLPFSWVASASFFSPSFGDVSYKEKGEQESNNQFDFIMRVRLRDVGKNIEQDLKEYRRQPHKRSFSGNPNRIKWFLGGDNQAGNIAYVLFKFSKDDNNLDVGKVADDSDLIIVDEYGNKLADEEQKTIKDRLPFKYEHVKTLRCSIDSKELTKAPWKNRRINFGHGHIIIGIDNEDNIQEYKNNMILYFHRLMYSVEDDLNRQGLYSKVLRNRGINEESKLQEKLEKLKINPYTLSLENRMLEKVENVQNIPLELRYSFPDSVDKFLKNNEPRQFYHLFGQIYHDYQGNFEVIAGKLIDKTGDALDAFKKNQNIKDVVAEWTKLSVLCWIGTVILALFTSTLVIYKILGRTLDKINSWLFPKVKLAGVGAYRMETNNLINFFDFIGLGRVARALFGMLGLWKPTPSVKIGSVIYPTKAFKNQVEEYISDVEEAITYNREERKAGRIPDSNIKSVCFFGPPGTGKTLTTKMIVENLASKDFIEYMLLIAPDVLKYNVSEAAHMIELIKNRAAKARKSGKPFCLVIQEIDAFGNRHFGLQDQVKKIFLDGLIGLFDEVGSPFLFILATMNPDIADPEQTKIIDAALQNRLEFIFVGYPSKNTLVDIFLYSLDKHAKKKMKIGDQDGIRQYLKDECSYIQKGDNLTGRDMDKVARDVVIRKRKSLRKENKGKLRGKGSLFVGDIKPVMDAEYERYTDIYGQEDENKKPNAN